MSKSGALIITAFMLATFAAGCTQPNGKSEESKQETQSFSRTADQVWVAKPDGSQQCGMGEELALPSGSEELADAGIKVMDSRKITDPGMRIQLCGSPTGQMNAYLIPASELQNATQLGFRELME